MTARGDAAYRKWLFSTPMIPVDVVRPWVEELVVRCESQNQVARLVRRDPELIRRILIGNKKLVQVDVAEDFAVAADRMVELAMALPETGVEGWSSRGRYCGDGSELHLGCGTWHHPESLYGLCGECTAIALGLIDMDTRDVRFTRERDEAKGAAA